MTKEQAQQVVNVIELLSHSVSATSISAFSNDPDSTEINHNITKEVKKKLVTLLTDK